jgi:hypothetical protein
MASPQFPNSPFRKPALLSRNRFSQPSNIYASDNSLNQNLATLSNRRQSQVVGRMSQTLSYNPTKSSLQSSQGRPLLKWEPSQSRELVRLFFDSDVPFKDIPKLLEDKGNQKNEKFQPS